MASPISIRINGIEYLDAVSSSISYGIESFARSFSFDFADKWTRSDLQKLPFVEGDSCEVYVHGEKIIDGFIDDIPISYDASSHQLSVTGRSWNAHLVDCSAIHKGGSWRKVKIIDIAKNLADPFGVGVKIDPWALSDASKPFRRWAIEDEETAYDCLQRAAEMLGLFLVSDNGRGITITKSSNVVIPGVLKFGSHILRANRTSRFSDRFSFYLVKSQRAGTDTWAMSHELVSGPFFLVEDPQVASYRPLVLVSDGQGSKEELKSRAAWEMNVRAGRSRRVTYDVLGHLSPNGKVWPVNELINISDPLAETSDALLIAAVSLRYGSDGEIATLELARPEAFDALRPPTKKKKGGLSAL